MVNDEKLAHELWDRSCDLVGLEKHDTLLEQLKIISRQVNDAAKNP